MRWPRFRLTVRRMMVAVAVVAFLIGGIEALRLRRLRASHLEEAAYHARREAEEIRNVAFLEETRRKGGPDAEGRSLVLMEQSSRFRVQYHAQLRRKYLALADRPWLPVAPDPKDLGEDLLWESMEIPPLDVDLEAMDPGDPSPPRR